MDISKLLTAGEWLDVPGIEGYADFGAFRLKVALTDPLEQFERSAEFKEIPETLQVEDKAKRVRSFTGQILELVVGWNFEADGVAVPCTDETKILHLRRLLFRRVMRDDGTFGEILASKIIAFSTSPESALKN